jgi:hypothetical protein
LRLLADFRNEALNGQRMRELMAASEFGAKDLVIPEPLLELTTRWAAAAAAAPPTGAGTDRAPSAGTLCGGTLALQLGPCHSRQEGGRPAHRPSSTARRRVLVMEWISGVKLTTLEAEEVGSDAQAGAARGRLLVVATWDGRLCMHVGVSRGCSTDLHAHVCMVVGGADG